MLFADPLIYRCRFDGSLVGVGMDLVEVSDVRESLARFGERFCRRVFTPSESASADSETEWVRRLAGAFAIKEAVIKALDDMQDRPEWTSIECLPVWRCWVPVSLHGSARRLADARKIERVLAFADFDDSLSGALVLVLTAGKEEIS